MEETVMNNIGFMEETTDMGDACREIDAAELLGEEQQQEPEGTVIEEDGGDGQQPAAQTDDQAEKNRVYAGMERSIKARLQKQFDADPEVAFARKLIGYYAQARGLERKDAVNFAESQFLQAVATMENVSPNVARMLYQKQEQPEQRTETNEEMTARRAREIEEDLKSIEMPEGFNFREAVKDERFAEMLLKEGWPTEAAIRVYHAENMAKNAPAEMAERLKARAAIPQPMKPQQPVAPKLDFNAMSDEEFERFEERYKRELARGNKVIF